ncbi:MAG: YceI family protein [Ignavibacteriae bacterium]|nr:YceI family protein [Ignavibacteriota bacterium]
MTKRMLFLAITKLSVLTFMLPVAELFSQPLALTVRREDSQVGFSISKWGVFKEEGRFKDFDGTIQFDPSNPSATTVDFTIQAASIDSRNEGRDRALRSQEFFNVSQYPTLTFKSVSATPLDKSTVEVTGDITIRGVTKRIVVPVKVLGVNHTGRDIGTLAGFEATFTINREDFRVADGWDIIGKEATIHLLIGAGTKPTTARR